MPYCFYLGLFVVGDGGFYLVVLILWLVIVNSYGLRLAAIFVLPYLADFFRICLQFFITAEFIYEHVILLVANLGVSSSFELYSFFFQEVYCPVECYVQISNYFV